MTQDPSADDLLILLAVARLGKFNAAASALNTTHTTISRRIAQLDHALGGRTLVRGGEGWELTSLGEEALRAAEQVEAGVGSLKNRSLGASGFSGLLRLSSPEAFSMLFVTPAIVAVQRKNPHLSVEIVSMTRRASQHRSGVDIEIVIGRPAVHNTLYIPLSEYYLRLYATPEYLEQHGIPTHVEDLRHHTLVSYIEAELQVAQLGRIGAGLPEPRAFFQSTGLLSQRAAIQQHVGIGLLPSFLAEPAFGFMPVLHDLVEKELEIGAVMRMESASSPLTREVINALREETKRRRDELTR